MANWKKVLVSGSVVEGSELKIDGHVNFLTGSDGLTAGASDDVVLVVGSDGRVKSRSQSDIQGITVASFTITGSDASNDTFDATSDSLTFSNSGDISAIVTTDTNKTILTLNLPDNIVSASQITGDGDDAISTSISGAFKADSASLAADITTNATNISSNDTDISTLQTVQGNILSATSSYAVSSSVIGTSKEVEVTANGEQGLQIGLPDDVEIKGTFHVSSSLTVSQSITADTLVLTGLSLVDNNAAVISGSNIFGDDVANDTHQFSGSVDITGSLVLSNVEQNNSVTVLDLLATDANNNVVNAGTAVQTEISNSLSGTDTNISNLQASASAGVFFSGSGGGFDLTSFNTASFVASGTGLTVNASTNTITYTINPSSVLDAALSGNSAGLLSSSEQIASDISGALSNTAIAELGAGIISSSAQIDNEFFDIDNIVSSSDQVEALLPDGIASGSFTSTTQGQIVFPGQGTLSINSLTAGANPSFGTVTATDLVVTGTTTTVNTTNLNIEDQFILLNSGALTPDGQNPDNSDKDGGFIVDFGGGSGSAFFYDADKKVWGVKGTNHASATQTDFLGYNTVASEGSDTAVPEYAVSVVSQSATNPTQGVAPTYGDSTAKTDHGTMHVNTNTGDIWIYS